MIGEALVDVVARADGSVSEHAGGSPANVAVGLARLGRATVLATELGDRPSAMSTAALMLASASSRSNTSGGLPRAGTSTSRGTTATAWMVLWVYCWERPDHCW